MPTFVLVPVMGWLFLAFAAAVYAAPFVFAVADAAGRPPSEWPRPWHRKAWIVALCLAIPTSISLAGQVLAFVYAVTVPRRICSEVARRGARQSRHSAWLPYVACVLAFGPLWLATGFDNSDQAMISGVAVCTAIVLVCLLTVAHHRAPRSRVALVALAMVVSGGAGFVVRAAWIDSCYRRCGSLPRDSSWVIPGFAAAGSAVTAWSTRPGRRQRGRLELGLDQAR